MTHILKSYRIPAETVNAIMMLYINTRSIEYIIPYMVRSPYGDTQFFEITTGVYKAIRYDIIMGLGHYGSYVIMIPRSL